MSSPSEVLGKLSDRWILEEVRPLHGLFVGQLTKDERAVLTEAERRGLAYLSYTGVSGLLGLGQVHVNPM